MLLKLNEKNLMLYAAKHYDNPTFSDVDEFYEDLKRFKYIKRLVNRYLENQELAERLILNHLVVVFNVFGIECALNILELKMNKEQFKILKPFLIFLKYITNDQYTEMEMDPFIVDKLRAI